MIPRRVLRYCFPGGTLRSGNVVTLPSQLASRSVWDISEQVAQTKPVPPSETCSAIIHSVLHNDGVDLNQWSIRVYDNELQGYRLLPNPMNVDEPQMSDRTLFHVSPECWRDIAKPQATTRQLRLDLSLQSKRTHSKPIQKSRNPQSVIDSVTNPQTATSTSTEAFLRHVDDPGTQDGYFGIGIVDGKTDRNLGTLWRSAWQLGAAYCFVVGQRFKKQVSGFNMVIFA